MVPPVTARAPSACMPSSPHAIVMVPPETVTVPLLWTPSSSEEMVMVPPRMVTELSPLMPFLDSVPEYPPEPSSPGLVPGCWPPSGCWSCPPGFVPGCWPPSGCCPPPGCPGAETSAPMVVVDAVEVDAEYPAYVPVLMFRVSVPSVSSMMTS